MMHPEIRNTPVVYGLVATTVAMALLTQLGANGLIVSWLLISGSYSTFDAFENMQLWRLVTPAFLHFNIYHLFFNLILALVMGRGLESIDGSKFLLTFFIITAIGSNLAQYFTTGPVFGGMSGVNYAFLGYIIVRSRANPPVYGRILPRAAIIFFLVWFAVCWTGIIPNVANTAHTAGLVIGMLWGFLRRSPLSYLKIS